MDVHRQMRKYYAGINTLIRRFYACSYDVKCDLFTSYMGKAHTNCIIGQTFCLHHITGTAFIIRLKLYVYIVENSETFQKIYSLSSLSEPILFHWRL